MFIPDNPIEDTYEDILERKNFAKHLGNSIYDWKQNENLVISLNGKWGVGKSSIINMAIQQINQRSAIGRPLIIRFNPWLYSNINDLTYEFFNELIAQLQTAYQFEGDQTLIDKIKKYAQLLNIIPTQEEVTKNFNQLFVLLGLIGISSSNITSLVSDSAFLKWVLFIGGVCLLVLHFGKNIFSKLVFPKKSNKSDYSAIKLKEQISSNLISRENRLLVIIDDIDRLTPKEINEVFQLVKINADFKNTTYLLSYDEDVVVNSLKTTLKIPGKKYLEKIVQVSFDVPPAQEDLIYRYLYEGLEKILNQLPSEASKLFNQNQNYWLNIFHSGIKVFFNDIRNVKRFLSSLEFNLIQMSKNGVMEVNIIDSIAIESLRVFEKDFYTFMIANKELFTETIDTSTSNKSVRSNALEKSFELLSGQHRESIKKLLKYLFPQLEGVLGNMNYGFKWIDTWTKDLRVCSPKHFDSYFMLIPKGSYNEISQYEFEMFKSKLSSGEDIRVIFNSYIESNKIIRLFNMMDLYHEEIDIPVDYIEGVIFAMLDLLGDKSSSKGSLFDRIDLKINRLVRLFLTSENNQENNYLIFKKAVSDFDFLSAVASIIDYESNNGLQVKLFNSNRSNELKRLCCEKILFKVKNYTIFSDQNLPLLLRLYREWSEDQQSVDNALNLIIKSDEYLIQLLKSYVGEQTVQSIDDYSANILPILHVEGLKKYVQHEAMLNSRITQIKSENGDLYINNTFLIDSYLNNEI